MPGVSNSSMINGIMTQLRFLRNAASGETPQSIADEGLIRMDEFPTKHGVKVPVPLVDAYLTRLWVAAPPSASLSFYAGFDAASAGVPDAPGKDANGRIWFKFFTSASGEEMRLIEPVPAGCVIAVISSVAGALYVSQTK